MEFGNRSEGDEVSGGGLNSKLQTLNLKEEEDIQRRDASGTACAGTAQLHGREGLVGDLPVFVFFGEGF